jgi:hypothetical protein
MNIRKIRNLLILSLAIFLAASYLAPALLPSSAATVQAQEADQAKPSPDVRALQPQDAAFPGSATQANDTNQEDDPKDTQNRTFERGDLSSWILPSRSTVLPAAVPNPEDGSYVAYFGGIPNANEQLYQPFAFPAEPVADAHLSFQVTQYGEETTPGTDIFCAALYDSDLNERLVELDCLDGAAASSTTFNNVWQQINYDLSGSELAPLRGQTVNLVFEMTTNNSLHTVVFVDDVELEIATGGTESDAHESNNTFAAATTLTVGQPMNNLSINPTNDEDFFTFSGSAGQVVVVDIDTDPTHSTLDSMVMLLNDRGQILCQNDDDPATFDSYLQCTLPYTGEYYVLVRSYDRTGSSSSTYTLSVNLYAAGSVPPPPQPAPAPPSPASGAAWTAMLYFAGDNDMCDEYPILIERMEQELGSKIGDDGFLNIVVQFDRHAAYCAGQDSTIRFVVQEDGNYQDGINHWDLGELNTGDPQTLTDFATWSMQNYPADHYYLAIDNHGGGLTGIASDTTDNDEISNLEMRGALKQITNNGQHKLDVLAYEACLMGLYETAYDVREFTDYLFFFETVSWPNREAYSGYLGDERFTPMSTGYDLGKIMFDEYVEAVDSPHTPALIDTAQLDELNVAVNAWADTLRALARTSKPAMTAARQAAQKIDILSDNNKYLDLWDLADHMAAQGLAVPQSEAVKAAIDAAVINTNNHSFGNHNYDNAHGLSIFWPEDTSGAYQNYINDQVYATTSESTWDEFLRTYNSTADHPTLPAEPEPPEFLPAKSNNTVYLPSVLR